MREIPAGQSLREFIGLAWSINRSDPNWIAPLRRTVEAALDRRRHPFHRHAEVAYFLAERAGRPIGRIAAILNHLHNEFHDDRTGFYGLFECENDRDAAAALFDAASEWLLARGCDTIRGPFNLSTNEEIASPGVLVEGFETAPTIAMGHNRRYYGDLHEAVGFRKCKDLLAIRLEHRGRLPTRGVETLDALLARYRATIRTVDLKRFAGEIEAIREIYNSAWSRNWGFVPMTKDEFDWVAREFRPIVDPDFCLIAEIDGSPIGFSLAIPDLNQAFRHIPDGRLAPFGIFKFLWHRRKIDAVRLITFGFRPPYQHSGLGVAFYLRTWKTAIDRGYASGEASWVLEDNQKMLRPLQRMGGVVTRRYRIFERPLRGA